eukprot:1179934-Pyramimonas_sp.AAC.1
MPTLQWSPRETFSGGWTTSHHLHVCGLSACIFGCCDENGSLCRCLSCAVLAVLLSLPSSPYLILGQCVDGECECANCVLSRRTARRPGV